MPERSLLSGSALAVLVADDESSVRDVIGEMLSDCGCDVAVAADGQEALLHLQQNQVDLAILDNRMPGLTGMQILDMFRNREDGPLIVILTALASVEDAAHAVRCDAFDFLTKPIRFEALAALVVRARKMLALRGENRRYREHLENLVEEKTAELRHKNQALENTCRELHTALQGAQRSSRLAALGELASGLAHELRNPLSAISLAAGNLRLELSDQPMVVESMGDIEHMVSHLSRILEDVLNFARPPAPRLQRANLSDVVEQSLMLAQAYLRKKSVQLELDLANDLPPALLDFAQCEQIMVNLIVNAARAMGENGGSIRLATWLDGECVCASVEDTGPGIPSDSRERIFAPFFSDFEGGTGLGLPISRNLAESHGGSLVATDPAQSDGGARFVLRLPVECSEVVV